MRTLRFALVGLFLAVPVVGFSVQPQPAGDSNAAQAPSYQDIERQRIDAAQKGVEDSWAWHNELVRKGRFYPLTLHAWLAELIELQEKEGGKAALEYCARRRIKVDGNRIHVAIEHRKWFGKKQRAELERLGEIVAEGTPLGVELKIPIQAIKGLSSSAGIYFVRPLPLDAEVERMVKHEKETRSDGQVMRGSTEKWRTPNGQEVEVGSGVVALGFKPVGNQKIRRILYTYACWIAQEHPALVHAKYSVAYREGDRLEEVIKWLGHDPEISFLEPMFLAKTEDVR